MGSISSKSIQEKNYSNIFQLKYCNQPSTLSCSPTLLLTCNRTSDDDNDIYHLYQRRRFCSKKKVLILGLDGVGKTDLFTKLICYHKKGLKFDSLPRPTIGKLVVNKTFSIPLGVNLDNFILSM